MEIVLIIVAIVVVLVLIAAVVGGRKRKQVRDDQRRGEAHDHRKEAEVRGARARPARPRGAAGRHRQA